MKIFGMCGSLRTGSSNNLILRAAQALLHKHQWSLQNLAELPYFDPDNQYSEQTPAVVQKMRQQAGESDLIFIVTPEYAHAMPGVLKNALEWLFCEATQKKMVAVIVGSGQGQHTRDQLLETLRTMDFSVQPDHCTILNGARAKFDSEGRINSQETQLSLAQFCQSLENL